MTVDQIYKYIDDYLILFTKSDTVTDKEFRDTTVALRYNVTIMETVRTKIVELGIAVKGRDMDGDTWTLTPTGHKVLKVGSWTAYFDRLEESEKLAIEQIIASITTDKSVRKTNTWQIIILLGTLFVALISTVTGLLNFIETRQQSKELRQLEKLVDTLKWQQHQKLIPSNCSDEDASKTKNHADSLGQKIKVEK